MLLTLNAREYLRQNPLLVRGAFCKLRFKISTKVEKIEVASTVMAIDF